MAVTFDSSSLRDGDDLLGTWHGDPAYSNATRDPHDIAVVAQFVRLP